MAENKERIACIKPDCKGDLNPLFEKHLKGYCMPCFDAIEKAARDLYIKNNIKDLNPFQNISDKVEILLTVFNYQQFYDPLINLIEYPKSKFELVAEMTEHELRKLSQKVSVQLKSPNQKERLHAVEIANLMAGLTNFDLDQLLLELLDVPESGNAIFRRSGSMVIEELLLRLQEGNTEVLLHLAFVDNESVTEKLISLLDNEESKIDNYHEALKHAALNAGWEITPTRQKRHLYYHQSQILDLMEPPSTAHTRLDLYTDAHLACPLCKGPLLLLANLAPQIVEKLLGSEIAPVRIPFYYCNQCSLISEEIFCEFEKADRASWHACNNIKYPPLLEPASLHFEDLPYKNLSFEVGATPQDPFLFYEFWLDNLRPHKSKFGGAPDWLQNCDYPTCPACQRLMKFILQIDAAGLGIFELDSHYAFFCDICRSISATVRQCT